MEIVEAHGRVTVPGLEDVEVDVDLYDWPVGDPAYPVTWSAVIAEGPELPVGTEGELHIDGENTARGHPFVVIMSAGHVTQLRGRENT